MLYSAYAIMAQHWLPWVIDLSVWFGLFASNMLLKDVSLRKKAGSEEYFNKSWLFLPNIFSWLTDAVTNCSAAQAPSSPTPTRGRDTGTSPSTERRRTLRSNSRKATKSS